MRNSNKGNTDHRFMVRRLEIDDFGWETLMEGKGVLRESVLNNDEESRENQTELGFESKLEVDN